MNQWNAIAEKYASLLRTEVSDVHYGVGIPGDADLGLLPQGSNGWVLDLGCGSGENLVALARRGFNPIGLDRSVKQLDIAARVLREHSVPARLICGDGFAHLSFARKFDVVISVGMIHFCSDLAQHLRQLASILKLGGLLIVSAPHPVDMLVDLDTAGELISLSSYFPPQRRIDSARYWMKFGGSIKLGVPQPEYLVRPSDLVTEMIDAEFEVVKLLEPEVDYKRAPCAFRFHDTDAEAKLFFLVPQYLIIVGRRL